VACGLGLHTRNQYAAWRAEQKTRPFIDTRIVNLTEDTAPTLVRFDDGTTQQCCWCGRISRTRPPQRHTASPHPFVARSAS